MNIISIVGIVTVAAMISVLLKKYNPEYSLLISIITGIIIIFLVMDEITPIVSRITSLINSIGVSEQYIKILLKCLGICFITQMASDSCRDAGEGSMGNKIEMAGRIAIAVLTIPMMEQLVETAISLIKA